MKQWLRDIGDLKKAMLKQSRALRYEVETRDGKTVPITPQNTLEMLINGVLFHSDAELRDRWDALNGFRNPGLVLIVVTTIWDMIQVFRALDSVVEKVIASPILNPDK